MRAERCLLVALMVAASTNFPELLALRFIDGMAAQIWMMARLTAISIRTEPSQRGRQVGWMFGMDNSGNLLGPLVGGLLAASWGIRSPFVAYAILALLAAIPAVGITISAKTPGELIVALRLTTLTALLFGVGLAWAIAF